MSRRIAIAVLLLIAAGAASRLAVSSKDESPGALAPRASIGSGYSNIMASDYVGPKVCGECHDDRYSSWQRHMHRVMNQDANQVESLVGDFSGVELHYGHGRARFELRDGQPQMLLERHDGSRRYRITRTIGARYLQEYVGLLVEGPEPVSHPAYSTEVRLPFGYWKRAGRWLHQQYFDSWYGPEHDSEGRLRVEPFVADAEPWRGRCAWCHNTYPFEFRLARKTTQEVGSGIEQLFEVSALFEPSVEAASGLLPVESLVTIGISCESCHFGGREHAQSGAAIRFLPTSPQLSPSTAVPPLIDDRKSARTVNSICAQCHSAPSPLFDSGAATRNSSEALDLMSGACRSQIRCTDCHDPHVTGPGARGADDPQHIEACRGCHLAYAEPDKSQAHSRHGAEVSCLDCHMPRIVQGISDSIRSHHISSPADPLVLGYSPSTCNLCHLDRGLQWTIDHLEALWPVSIDREAVARGRYGGDFGRPLGEQWLDSERSIDRITAAAAYARSSLGASQLDRLIRGLDDPVAYDRMRYLFAIEEVLGRSLGREEYDPAAEPVRRRAMVEALLRARHR